MAFTAVQSDAVAPTRPSKAALFRAELVSPELSFAMEAHNGLSAKVVEEAGFRVIWASGLSISAALGVRDNNEASWTQVLETLEFMADATTVPILVDGDTGYGNFNNMRRLVRKLCQRGIAAVCIEDKLFPKTNSFIGEAQPLADIEEFCGKIKAGKDSQTDPDFAIVARIEALIAGWGMDEALRRAAAYHEAGADAILIHSKAKTADEVVDFAAAWDDRCPIVLVPTMYYGTPTDRFRTAGVSLVIWANHNLRAALTAMRDVSQRIQDEQSLAGVEGTIASVQDVFELTDNRELREAERRYLSRAAGPTSAIVLAASRGAQLKDLTVERPKCMLDIRGKPLLRRLVTMLHGCGVRDVTVVRGYRKEAIDLPGVDYADNDDYAATGEVASLFQAIDRLTGDCVLSYGDILFRRFILEGLLDAEGDIVLAIDGRWRERTDVAADHQRDLVVCSQPFSEVPIDDDTVTVERIGAAVAGDVADGEWIGLAKLTAAGAARVRAGVAAMTADGTRDGAGLPELLARLVAAGERVTAFYIAGQWLDVNDAFDLASARNLF